MDALEAALAADLATAAGAFAAPVLTWAGLAGDCALLDAAARAGLLGRVAVVFIDTLHLFPETAALLAESEARYGFKAKRYSAAGCATKAEWNKRHASDLYMTDPEQYDQARTIPCAYDRGAMSCSESQHSRSRLVPFCTTSWPRSSRWSARCGSCTPTPGSTVRRRYAMRSGQRSKSCCRWSELAFPCRPPSRPGRGPRLAACV